MVADLRAAVIGSAVWLMTALATAAGALDLTLIDVLLVLAPRVLVPVGLVAGQTDGGTMSLLLVSAAADVAPGVLLVSWAGGPT